jgi:hypothetical protein
VETREVGLLEEAEAPGSVGRFLERGDDRVAGEGQVVPGAGDDRIVGRLLGVGGFVFVVVRRDRTLEQLPHRPLVVLQELRAPFGHRSFAFTSTWPQSATGRVAGGSGTQGLGSGGV